MTAQRVPVLKGETTMLRPMTESDQELFRRWLTESEELRKQIDDPRIPTPEDQERWYRRSMEPDRRLFSVLTLDDTLLGNAGLVDMDRVKGTAQFRITLGNREFHGKGHGRDASMLLLRYAFTSMELSLVWLRVRTDNDRAVRLYRSLGFVEEQPDTSSMLRMTLTRESFFASHP